MERRTFIQALGAATATAAAGLPLRAQDASATGRVTLLHTNDTHSRIEPYGPGSEKNLEGRGGMARRATLVRQVRRTTPNVLLLDAGDVFQGTPFFNQYKGHLDYKLMSLCGYDAGTLGNHDFDNGVEGLVAAMEDAKFDFVNCNFDAKGAPKLAARLKPWIIKEFPGVKVGITGCCIDFKGLVSAKNHAGVDWREPAEALKPVVAHLREKERVDLVVVLSHLGFDVKSASIDDKRLAVAVPGIDVIIGGHTHTFMDAPLKIQNAAGETEIFQVGHSGVNLGRMDYAVRKGVKVASSGMALQVLA
ncbi:bifunctional metallophosphatase/5'-nucleotidase [Mesoterricola sediminis]|uniref:Metallophosphatase n=1 Tax=Mesoterricola sediminis TaxID=2927980 RepID=A0AA48KCH2_9BACT|nr:metallophosphoesterase [Mesoterricola sediminis]BDU77149.1 metallophosphatase [Mesoterricola sediminis]